MEKVMMERNPLPGGQPMISPLPVLGGGVSKVATTVYARIPPAAQAAGGAAPWSALQQRPAGPSFAEGLTPGPAGTLYLVDIPWGRVLQVLDGGETRTVLQYDGQPNGLALRPGGGALLADFEHGLLQVDELTPGAEVRPLLTRYGMDRFKGLNDVRVARNGEVYFTDQGGTGLHDPSGRIYCLRPDGELRIILDGLPSPNALALDEASRVLYVAVTRDNAVWRIPLRADGTVAKAGRYIQLSGGTGPDGIALTSRGWLLVTHLGLGVVWLFDSKGRPVLAYDCPGDDPTSVTVAPGNQHAFIAEASSGSILTAALPGEAVGGP
jgi:gluconolactonase